MDLIDAVLAADGIETGERASADYQATEVTPTNSLTASSESFKLPPSLASKLGAQQYPGTNAMTLPFFEDGDEEEASISPISVMHFKRNLIPTRVDQPTGIKEWTARTPQKLRKGALFPGEGGGTALPAVSSTPSLSSFSDMCPASTPEDNASMNRLSSAGRAALERARSGLSTDAPKKVALLSSAGLAALQRARSSSVKASVVKAPFPYMLEPQSQSFEDDEDQELRTEDPKQDEAKPQARAMEHTEAQPTTQTEFEAPAKPQACEQMGTPIDTAIMKASEKLAIANATKDSKAKQEAELEALALIAVIHRVNKAKKVKELKLDELKRAPTRLPQDHIVLFLILFAACFLWTVYLQLMDVSESEPDSAHPIGMRRAIERRGPWRWVFLRA